MPSCLKNFTKKKPSMIKLVDIDKRDLPNIQKVLDLIINFKKEKRNSKSSKDASTDIPKFKRVANQCADLAINCIASHRYKEAINLLWILTQDKSINITFLSKAILIALLNIDVSDKDVWNCIQALQKFKKLHKKEILLEYMMYALKSNIYDVQIFEAELSKRYFPKKLDEIESTFEAYTAMIENTEWSEQCYGDGDVLPSQSQSTNQKFQLICEKLIREPGNWDIFILKLIKIMPSEINETNPQIEELLLTYINSNSDNINAYIYLCTYLYHCNPESENLEKYLKIIADMNPSDIRVLWLLEIWTRQKIELEKRLKYLFMFLDYPSNRKNISAWRKLKQYLSEITFNEDQQNILQNLWMIRSRSWEWMHFNPHSNELDLENKELILVKVDVLSFFFQKHKFIKKARKLFPDIKDEVL